jgi:hypothetical protein
MKHAAARCHASDGIPGVAQLRTYYHPIVDLDTLATERTHVCAKKEHRLAKA